MVDDNEAAAVVTMVQGKGDKGQSSEYTGNQLQLPPIIVPQLQSNTAANKRNQQPRQSSPGSVMNKIQLPAAASKITGKQEKAGKKPLASDMKTADEDKDWKCVNCKCPGNLTPVKRLGPDGKRNICNACYIRGRASKERGMKGSARPNVNNISSKRSNPASAEHQQQPALQYQNAYYGAQRAGAGGYPRYAAYGHGYSPYMVPGSSNPLLSPTSLHRQQQHQYYDAQNSIYNYAMMAQQHALVTGAETADPFAVPINQQQQQPVYTYQQYPVMNSDNNNNNNNNASSLYHQPVPRSTDKK